MPLLSLTLHTDKLIFHSFKRNLMCNRIFSFDFNLIIRKETSVLVNSKTIALYLLEFHVMNNLLRFSELRTIYYLLSTIYYLLNNHLINIPPNRLIGIRDIALRKRSYRPPVAVVKFLAHHRNHLIVGYF